MRFYISLNFEAELLTTSNIRYSAQPWLGEKFVSKSVQDLSVRLEEILNIRVVHEQLTRYLFSLFFISVTYLYLCYFMIDSSSFDIFCPISKD